MINNTTKITNPSLFEEKISHRLSITWEDYDWVGSHQNGFSFLEDLYEKGLKYTADSEIDITIGDKSVYISDGVNPIHKITVDARGSVIASWVGIKAPTNKPRISLEEYGRQTDNIDSSVEYSEDISGSNLGGIGLIRCQYTVVTDTGEESNPSPASDFINGQFFKIGSDGISDERLIKSISVYDLNVPDVPRGVLEHLSYFKIYYQIMRYSQGIDIGNMEFSVQVDIKSKTFSATDTNNDYTISNIKTSGSLISYENDTGFPCKTSAVNAGVLMVGNIRKSATIPGDFQYMTPITVNNQNNSNYVDAVVKIVLDANDIVNKDGEKIFEKWSDFFRVTGGKITWASNAPDAGYYSRHIRLYDQDMTTPIMVYVPEKYYGGTQKLDIYIKIPLLKASTSHTLYLCWNAVYNQSRKSYENPVLDSGKEGITDDYNKIVEDEYDWDGNIGVHYGRWVLLSDDVSAAQHRQQVFQERRVPSGGTEILTVPGVDFLGFGDDGEAGYDLVNRANTNCHGEAGRVTDPLVVQTAIYPLPSSTNMSFSPSELDDRNPDNFTERIRLIDTFDHTTDLVDEFVESSVEDLGNRFWVAAWEYTDDDNEFGGRYVAAQIVGLVPDNDVVYSGIWRFRSEKIDSDGLIVGNPAMAVADLTSSKNRGIIEGLNPLSSVGTEWGFGNNYLLENDVPYTELPPLIDKILSAPLSGLKKLMPRLLETETVKNILNDSKSENISNFYTLGAFKPWCNGWSFRKTAVNIGKMPNKGYLYTNVCFKLGDLVRDDWGGHSLRQGISHVQTEERYVNTIFYVSCGSINDADATPNTLLSQNPYPGDNEWTQEGSAYNETYQVADVKYNADNFRPTSESGAAPGTITLDSDGMPENGNALIGEYTVDEDPATNTDPINNMFWVRIERMVTPVDTEAYILSLNTQTMPGYSGSRACAIHIDEFYDDANLAEFKNLFIYLTWDIPNETFTLGYSLLDSDSRVKTTSTDFSSGDLKQFKISESFENKTLYDIGLGNSTYMNRVISGTHRHKTFNFSGFHGFYGTVEMTTGRYITDRHSITAIRDGMPIFENPVGIKYDDGGGTTDNNNISIKDTIQNIDKAYENMMMWSNVGKDGLPDLNYKLTKEPIIKILSAPSFLKLEYTNTFLIFTRNTISRFILKGTDTGWAGSAESLIEEQKQYGLYAPKTLAQVSSELIWLSEEGVIRWSPEGFSNISQNVIDLPINESMFGYYCPTKNQYILHDNDTKLSYVYNLSYKLWTMFDGIDVISSSILSGSNQLENINLLLNSEGVLEKYPSENKTQQNSYIKTMDLFMDSGQIRRVKVGYNGSTSAKLVYNLAYTDNNSDEITKIETINNIQKNVWRGLGDIGMTYGRVASFEVHDADEINTILYDAISRGGE